MRPITWLHLQKNAFFLVYVRFFLYICIRKTDNEGAPNKL